MALDWLTQDLKDRRPALRPTARPEFVTPFGPVTPSGGLVTAIRPATPVHVPAGGLSHAPPALWPAGAAPPSSGVRRRLRGFLAAHRVRTHLMSGIEFHAAVFVLAPLAGAGALLPVTAGAGTLLVLNEIFLIYRMWQATRGVPARVPRPAHRLAACPDVRTDPFRTGMEIR
jgi:hypothetical protein